MKSRYPRGHSGCYFNGQMGLIFQRTLFFDLRALTAFNVAIKLLSEVISSMPILLPGKETPPRSDLFSFVQDSSLSPSSPPLGPRTRVYSPGGTGT